MKVNLMESVVEADLASLQQAMQDGLFRSEELTAAYLERISRFDTRLHSILEVNPDALEVAAALDRERDEQGCRGPLHGIPLLLKDNINTADRMHTSAGALALASHCAAEDSEVAHRLRQAGAVLLGKTNMTEWANFMSPSMWAGYSTRGGLTLNPYGPGEIFVGGSSSGSAAAVAMSLAAAAVGTETSGSIISPASQHSLVGLKPTVGLVSQSGIIPIAHSQDSAGPMTRTVKDAAILLSIMAGPDETFCDYTRFLNVDVLRQARIGIPRYFYKDLDDERLAVAEAAIEALRKAGATIIDPVDMFGEGVAWDAEVMRHEFKYGVNRYLGSLPADAPVHSLEELIAYNEAHTDKALKYGQDTLIWSEQVSGTLTEEAYLASKRRNRDIAGKGIDDALAEHRLDALLFLGYEGGSDLAARAGYPIITVPAGYAKTGVIAPGGYSTHGPQGMSFVGTAHSEPVLLALAYGYEQATKHRVPPNMA